MTRTQCLPKQVMAQAVAQATAHVMAQTFDRGDGPGGGSGGGSGHGAYRRWHAELADSARGCIRRGGPTTLAKARSHNAAVPSGHEDKRPKQALPRGRHDRLLCASWVSANDRGMVSESTWTHRPLPRRRAHGYLEIAHFPGQVKCAGTTFHVCSEVLRVADLARDCIRSGGLVATRPLVRYGNAGPRCNSQP